MKRSTVNKALLTAKEVLKELRLSLPPFASWTVEDWESKGHEADEIRECHLGWDVTDFGQNRFEELGRILFTLRNGDNKRHRKTYAEKFILNPENQKPPLHFHFSKMEDIVNRGGGNLLIRLMAATSDGDPSDEDFTVQIDGITHHLKADTIIRLEPGQSVCLPPYLIHQFWGEEGTGIRIEGVGYVVSGEISSVCDDYRDNRFLEPCERFPTVEEDEPALHYLCNEYPPCSECHGRPAG